MNTAGSLALAAGSGALGAVALWRLTRATFAQPLFARTNHRGRAVPTAAGILIPVGLIAVASVLVLAESASVVDIAAGPLLSVVLAAVGFGLLGLLDDLAGDGSSRGFSGHLRALVGGELTTGAVKLFGGAAVAVLAASTMSVDRPGRLVADALLIALAANLANLFDRAPGRVTKVALLVAVPIVVSAGADDRLLGPAIILGAAVGLLHADLREQLMLGDSGANVVGAAAGVAVVFTAAPDTRTIVLVVVAALNLVSERVSFSRVIAAAPPLRAIDRWGRPR